MSTIRPKHPASLFILIIALWAASPGAATAAETAPARVAVLPFNMHTPSQLHYLQDGIRDMLTSRLSAQGKVQVLDASSVQQAIGSLKGDISSTEALRIGKSLRADHVLFGSVTSMGQSISIDAKMAPVTGDKEPLSLYAQTKGLDDVIPKINQFAQEINQKVFGQKADSSKTASDDEGVTTRNPELLLAGAFASKDRISYINPNFVEITPEASLRQPGLWRSQTFKGGIVGMDIGDVDGDGKLEMVTVAQDKVTVYRRDADGMKVIGTYKGSTTDNFIWVTLADTDRDRIMEIYVTNLRKKLTGRQQVDNSVLGDRGFTEDLSSFVMSLSGGRLQPAGKTVPYFLNAVEFPGRGKVLLGQRKGVETEGPFHHEIVEMQLRGGTISPATTVPLPSRCNVFNFAVADINNDRSNEYVVIERNNTLAVLSSSGSQLWKGEDVFAATTNAFEGKVMDRRYNYVEHYAIPSPIIVTDVNKDNIPEIVVNRNTDTRGRLMPQGLQYWDRGEIVSLSWDQMGLVENWKTRDISGMVTSIRIGDMNNDGTTELVASLVLAKDFLKLWESNSTIFSYDLNVGSAKPEGRVAAKDEETRKKK